MPCCPTCACAGEPFECLAALYPAEWAKFRTYCEGTDPNLRRHVRDRSELGWSPDAPVAVPPGLALPARPPEYAFKAGEAPRRGRRCPRSCSWSTPATTAPPR